MLLCVYGVECVLLRCYRVVVCDVALCYVFVVVCLGVLFGVLLYAVVVRLRAVGVVSLDGLKISVCCVVRLLLLMCGVLLCLLLC